MDIAAESNKCEEEIAVIEARAKVDSFNLKVLKAQSKKWKAMLEEAKQLVNGDKKESKSME